MTTPLALDEAFLVFPMEVSALHAAYPQKLRQPGSLYLLSPAHPISSWMDHLQQGRKKEARVVAVSTGQG